MIHEVKQCLVPYCGSTLTVTILKKYARKIVAVADSQGNTYMRTGQKSRVWVARNCPAGINYITVYASR